MLWRISLNKQKLVSEQNQLLKRKNCPRRCFGTSTWLKLSVN